MIGEFDWARCTSRFKSFLRVSASHSIASRLWAKPWTWNSSVLGGEAMSQLQLLAASTSVEEQLLMP